MTSVRVIKFEFLSSSRNPRSHCALLLFPIGVRKMYCDSDCREQDDTTDGVGDDTCPASEEGVADVDKGAQNMWAALRVDSLRATCSYSTAGPSELPAQPGLKIAELGDVLLPLAQGQALQSVDGAQKVAHGVDKRCKAWALPPSSVAFSNPAWLPGLQQLLGRVKHELGCEKVRCL